MQYDCDGKYIGQTKRMIITQFNEHFAYLKYKKISFSRYPLY